MGRLLSASVPCSGPGKRWCWNERVVSLEQNIRLLIEQRKLANYVKIWLVCLCSVAFAWITGDQIIYALLQITELLLFFFKGLKNFKRSLSQFSPMKPAHPPFFLLASMPILQAGGLWCVALTQTPHAYFVPVISHMFCLFAWHSLSLAKYLLFTSLTILSFIYLPSSDLLQYIPSHRLTKEKKTYSNKYHFYWITCVNFISSM